MSASVPCPPFGVFFTPPPRPGHQRGRGLSVSPQAQRVIKIVESSVHGWVPSRHDEGLGGDAVCSAVCSAAFYTPRPGRQTKAQRPCPWLASATPPPYRPVCGCAPEHNAQNAPRRLFRPRTATVRVRLTPRGSVERSSLNVNLKSKSTRTARAAGVGAPQYCL